MTESSEPSIISAPDQSQSISEIEIESLKSIQDTDQEGHDPGNQE